MNGNIEADPMFCVNAEADSFAIASNSPCAPGNHPDGVDCGIIGARGIGCGPVPVRSSSWGRIKALLKERQ